jgi:hypothetical protein
VGELFAGYHTPRQHFANDGMALRADVRCATSRTAPNAQRQPSLVDAETFRRSLCGYDNNSFVRWLRNVVSTPAADAAAERYKLGTSKRWRDGATVFWQIDTSGNVRAGKIMLYDADGHRRHDVKPAVQWVHSLLKLPNYELAQCLFGEHLLADASKIVAVVESEKTEVVASVYYPKFILACLRRQRGLVCAAVRSTERTTGAAISRC